jgi:hypothetical protein
VDPLGLLAAGTAIIAYPGGAYLLAAALVGGRPAALVGVRWTASAAAATACALMAAALLPLPGSPALSLPDRSGAAPNLLGLLVLLTAAVVLAGPPRWSPRRLVLAAAAAAPALAPAAAAATLSLPVIVGLPGSGLMAARDLAGAALLLGAPQLVPESPATPPAVRAIVLGVVVLAGMCLWVPALLPAFPGAATAALLLLAVAAHGRLAPWLVRRAARPAAAVAAAAGLAAVVLAAIAVPR